VATTTAVLASIEISVTGVGANLQTEVKQTRQISTTGGPGDKRALSRFLYRLLEMWCRRSPPMELSPETEATFKSTMLTKTSVTLRTGSTSYSRTV